MPTPTPDWDALRTAAREAMTHAYAPYSAFPVGVAGLVHAPADSAKSTATTTRRVRASREKGCIMATS